MLFSIRSGWPIWPIIGAFKTGWEIIERILIMLVGLWGVIVCIVIVYMLYKKYRVTQ